MNNNRNILVLNGKIFNKNKLLKFISNYTNIICADGAANKLIGLNIIPNIIIGDMDSIKKKYQNEYNDKILKIINQNLNDLNKCLIWLKHKKIKEIDIIGFDGKRFDHSIGNFSVILNCISFININIYTDYGKFITVDKKLILKNCKHKSISVFNSSKKVKISSKNLKYELKNFNSTNLHDGTLNYALKNQVFFKSNGKFLIYIAY